MRRAGVALVALMLALGVAGYAAAPSQAGEPPSAKAIFERRHSVFDARAAGAGNALAPPAPVDSPGAATAPVDNLIRVEKSPTGLRYRIKLLEEGGSLFVPNNRVFRTGEQIQLLLTSNVDAHLAILQIAEDGAMELLYPDSELGLTENRVQAYKEVLFPGPEHGFRFVDQPGTERLLVILAQHKHQLDKLNLKTRIDGTEGSKLLDEAAELAGDKRLQIVEVARSEEATYAVNIGGGYVLQEIRLTHH